MKVKNIVTLTLLVFIIASVAFLIFKESRYEMKNNFTEGTVSNEKSGSMESPGAAVKTNEPGHKVIACYFHGTRRCPTCRKIEAYTTESIKTAFAEQLKSGRLEFHVVNVDEPQNKHYIYDYNLTTKSVVLAYYLNGEQTRWKNLQRVWQYVVNKQTFMDYIENETKDYLGELLYE